MSSEQAMIAAPKTLKSGRDREALGWVLLILVLLKTPASFSFLKQEIGIPNREAILSFGACLGAISVLIYSYRSLKAFGECMYVCMRIALVALVVLTVVVFVGLNPGGFLGFLILFLYYGLFIDVGAAAVVHATAACAGGAFTFGALRVVKLVAQRGRS